ncbi:MAG: hypothetical protein KAJ76_09670 [Candidatus Heimdallarchaeota archaeon]|nr:hypothetical protein [Candidatus Heimdallarchaeota archaeon]MCK5185164.1 hypothetical protein [Candidatus Heimdallarchaeota archaeon]MCK5299163.1 hypothetical protein [Candidatus Heimdallarchaeota archaeon]
MSNKNSIVKTTIRIAILAIMLSCSVIMVYTPFTTRNWTVGVDTYEYETFFFGKWNFYNNTEMVSTGGSDTLDSFQILSPILIIAGLVLSVILVPTLGFFLGYDERNRGNTQRILGIFIAIVGIIGFIGVMLQLSFINYLKILNIDTKIGAGFIFSMILFVLITLFGLVFAILPKRNEQLDS